MKKYLLLLIAFIAVTSAALWLSSCKKDKVEDINTLVYALNSNPQGASYAKWSQNWWTWFLNMDCTHHAYSDTTGASAGLHQSGPVFFLTGSPKVNDVRSVTIPSGKDIFFPIFNYINDYPCPDTSFHPAAGETLEHFLQASAKDAMDRVTKIEVTLDGVALTNPSSYRVTTGLYSFTGNAVLSGCFDPCITGTEQSAISDGYWVMLKALPKGDHKLHFHGEVSAWNWVQDVTFNIKVE